MNPEQRAALVRECRLEIKQKRRRGFTGATSPGAGSYYDDDELNVSVEPRRGESMSAYMNRRATSSSGDGDLYDAAARWDRHRATAVPKWRRRFTPRAPRDPGGYVGYEGDWQSQFQGYADHARPVRGPSRRRGARRKPGFAPAMIDR